MKYTLKSANMKEMRKKKLWNMASVNERVRTV